MRTGHDTPGTGRLTAALAASLLAACCGPGGWVHEVGSVNSKGGASTLIAAPDAGPADGGGGGSALALVGAPCEASEQCVTSFCMTTGNIGAFIKGAVVPGGYCSALFCAVDGSDGACTSAIGGTCFSLFPFLGATYGAQGICLAPCTSDDDCRTGDDEICFDARTLVDDGLVAADLIAQYYPSGSRGCLPRTVRDAAIAKLQKNQGQ
jgi:hypothetical protein